MKIKKSKVTRIITVLLSTVMFFEQFATTDAMFYSHAEDVLSEDYSIEHRITSTWDGGCSAEIILTNLSDKDTKDWTVTFCTTDEITNLWGGTITECREQKTSYGTENKDEKENGKENVEETDNYYGTPDPDDECTYYCYTIKAVNYNGVIGAGKGITIGYNASGDDHDIWDESAELAFESEKTEEVNGTELQSNEKGVVNEKIEDTTYVFESEDYAVNYTVQSHWDGHCNVKIEIENHSKEKMNNWNLTFFTEDMINNPYNAILVADGNEEGRITLKNAGYNQDIIAGGSVSFGFEVLYGERFDRPEAFYLGDEESVVSRDLYTFTNTITSEWDDGCTGALTIQNLGENVIEDWSLVLRVDGSIISTWGGNLKEIGNGIYEIECPDHSQNILAGDSVTIGYQAVQKPDITLLELREKNSLPNGMGTSVSGNGDNYKSDVGEEQHIFIDTEAFHLEDTGIYLVDDEVEFISGYTNYEYEFEMASIIIEDISCDIIWEGKIQSEDGYITWIVKELGLVQGVNNILFSFTDKDGNEIEDRLVVINTEFANMARTAINLTDSDNDGVYDYYEKFYDTDPELADTDGDTLSDGEELYLLNLDPTLYDTDDDGISDAEEDNDEDGLIVLQEVKYGSSDWCIDSDADGLDDEEEANIYGTDPIEYDTDHDGFSDKEEINLGLNPFSKDSDGDGIVDGNEVLTQTKSFISISKNNAFKSISVEIACKGSIIEQLHIKENHNTIISKTPGMIGIPLDIRADFDFDTAQITFVYDEDMLGETDEDNLCMMWYNEKENNYVLLEDSICDTINNTVTYTTTHFSTYFVVDRGVWREFNTEPIDYTDYSKTVNENYDFVVFIDYTVSEEDLEKEKQIASSIIAQMEDGDRVLFFYVISDNLEMITDRSGAYKWATTKEEALKNMDPNTGLSALELFMRGGYSVSNTYDGRADYCLEAINAADSKGNKKMAYLLYPGKLYDGIFQNNSLYMSSEAAKAKNDGSVFNTVSITYAPSVELDTYVNMLGGKQYVGDENTIMSEIAAELAHRVDFSDGHVNDMDSDGDGLLDVWETKGMRAANGWVVYSDPLDMDGDTDGDGYSDAEEVGKYDQETGDFIVISDPSDPNSTPENEPVYIIGWSYSKDEVKDFEYHYCLKYPDLDLKGDTITEWDQFGEQIWDDFAYNNSFCRAAETKKRELIAAGVDSDQIVFRRIDDNWSGENSLKYIWNNEWKKYGCIKELHMFTHGNAGQPVMYKSPVYIDKIEDFNKLSWHNDARVYFYGCHTAQPTPTVPPRYHLQNFANIQGVVAYGSVYGTSFSSLKETHVKIDPYGVRSKDIYLNSYGIPKMEALAKGDPTVLACLLCGTKYTPMKMFTPQ